MKFMLPEVPYKALQNELEELSNGIIISAVMDDQTQSTKLLHDFTLKFPQSKDGESTSYIWDLMTMSETSTIMIAKATKIIATMLIINVFTLFTTSTSISHIYEVDSPSLD